MFPGHFRRNTSTKNDPGEAAKGKKTRRMTVRDNVFTQPRGTKKKEPKGRTRERGEERRSA